jgi:hypothetical protein
MRPIDTIDVSRPLASTGTEKAAAAVLVRLILSLAGGCDC